MPDPRAALQTLAADCVVRVGRDLIGLRDEGGSGVWIAPGILLTCAHVVPEGAGAKVQLHWRDQLLNGVVRDHTANKSPDGGLWSFPDLAVVTVDRPPVHPCAWLAETVLFGDASLTVLGHSGQLGEGLRPAIVQGRLSGSQVFGDGMFWQFKGNEVQSGMSGGPVIDMASGAVCGLMKTTIGEDADRGGYLIPVSALRHLPAGRRAELLTASDRFHSRDRRWTSLRAGLPARPRLATSAMDPNEEVELLGLLADVPPIEQERLEILYAECAAHDRSPSTDLEALRDVAYALADDAGPHDDDWVLPLLKLSHRLAGADPTPQRRGLYDWATAFSARHGKFSNLQTIRKSPTTRRTSAFVTVEIAPGCSDIDRYRLTVSVSDDRTQSRRLYCDDTPRHTLKEAKELACAHLRSALCWLSSDAFVEFVVPSELFDEPFEELSPIRSYSNLGRRFRVVLRDYERQNDPYARGDWIRRWERLNGSSSRVHWALCTDDMDQDEFAAELESHPETAVIALSRRPSSNTQVADMVKVALESGVPVLVWRRGTCGEHDSGVVHGPCSGLHFKQAFAPVLESGPCSSLPAQVQKLRIELGAKHRSPSFEACRGIILVWDDPHRTVQGEAPLMEPPFEPVDEAI